MMSKPTPLLLLLLLIFCFSVSYCSTHKSSITPCPKIEKQALLSFKQSITRDPDNVLSSWNTSLDHNCCNWKGVSCSNSTGRVDGLHLGGGFLQGQISPSLLNLRQLKHLDLSFNSFEETMPSFMGSLASLQYLELSYAGFHGMVPHTIGNLSNLKSLDLECFDHEFAHIFNYPEPMFVDNLEWLSGLSQLQHLILNNVNLSRAANWVQVINTLPSLVELRLPSCSLDYMAPVNDVNTTSLTILDLSSNNFHSLPIPRWIFQQSNLIVLDVGQASFDGPIPAIANFTKLQHLDLSGNSLNSSIPDWLYSCKDLEVVSLRNCSLENKISDAVENLTSLATLHLFDNDLTGKIPSGIANLCKMEELELGNNLLEGEISDSFGNMSDCFLGALTYLDLSYNQLSGHLTHQFGVFKSLPMLFLSKNKISGEIPENIGSLSSLYILDLGYNNLRGNLPVSLGQLSNLESLSLESNTLTGNLPMSLGQLSKLEYLSLKYNMLTGKLPTGIWQLSKLLRIYVRNNKLTGNLPRSMGKLSNLRTLDVRYNKLIGNLPMSMGQLFNLKDLYIGNNMLEGVVTEIHFANLTKLSHILASGNHLTLKVNPNWIPPFNLRELELGSWNLGAGAIPSWLHTQKNTLINLDLSNTGISGNVPTWFWECRVLNLSHNHLYGNIPDMRPESQTMILHLNSNLFSGLLPRVGYSMEAIILSNNSFSGGISHLICDSMIGGTNPLLNLDLSGNHLTGEIPDCWMNWPSLQVLNLGNNNFSGTIPNSIGFLTHLMSLNLYGNKLSGEIPVSISNCTELVKMDLSRNYLVGNISTWMGASLAELRFLILRSNKLSGVIPLSICYLEHLQILDISYNVISGTIPVCVNNFTAMATKRTLSEYFSTNVYFSTSYDGTYLMSVSVATNGNEYEYSTILSLVTDIDLSNNNLSGEIPKELTSLKELVSLNLSGNHLTGSIPKSIGDMKQLESLDFSRNSLFGEIPNSMRLISSLSCLNLSYNRLTGKIPESTQLLGMNASSFMGNNLCGPPLPTNCSHDDDAHGPLHKEDDKDEIDWFYVFLSLGYALGFSVFCTTLVLKKSWRTSYFGLIECMWDKFYVYFHIKWAKLTRP